MYVPFYENQENKNNFPVREKKTILKYLINSKYGNKFRLTDFLFVNLSYLLTTTTTTTTIIIITSPPTTTYSFTQHDIKKLRIK